jgi:hypothetical protein
MKLPSKITATYAGRPRQLPMRTRWAGRVAQFTSEVIRQEVFKIFFHAI